MATAARLVPALSDVSVWGPWTLALAVVLALAGCATMPGTGKAPRSETPVPPKTAAPQVQTGIASWYGKPHHGRLTASGEVYDMNALTAAHPSLPLGSRVLVTNLKNGRSVEVRVNDRGPVVPGRIIDLSYAAARALDAVDDGAFSVRVRVLPERSKSSGPTSSPDDARGRRGAIAWQLWAADDEGAPLSTPGPFTPEMPEAARARSTWLPWRRS